MNYFYNKPKNIVHHKSFPETFRMLIVGQSGCGKTCLLMKLLLEPNLLNYDKLYIFSRSLYQPEYQALEAGFNNHLPKEDIISILNAGKKILKKESSIEELALALRLDNDDHNIKPSTIETEFHNNPDDIPDPADINKSIINLIIFDDIMTDRKQTTAENYYTRGRSANCDCIYLSQNYTHLPLHTIRSNSNFMVFFKSSPLVIEQLYRAYASTDMDFIEFKKLCAKAWASKFGYLVIDLSRDYSSNDKYRSNILVA